MWIGVSLTALLVGAFGLIYAQNSKVPELGVDNGRFKPLSNRPNGVSTQAKDPSKQVEPWPMKTTREETLQAIVSAVNSFGGADIKAQSDDYIYAVFTTPLMKYHDDAEFYLDSSTGQVHFRSASRAGRSDLGLNRKRFGQLTQLYQR